MCSNHIITDMLGNYCTIVRMYRYVHSRFSDIIDLRANYSDLSQGQPLDSGIVREYPQNVLSSGKTCPQKRSSFFWLKILATLIQV